MNHINFLPSPHKIFLAKQFRLCYMICIMEPTFTTRDICRKLKIKERMLIHWAEKRLIRPLKDADGYASRRQYSVHNVLEIAVIKALWGKASNIVIQVALLKLNEFEGNYKNLPDYLIILGNDPKRVFLLSASEVIGKTKTDRRQFFISQLYKSDSGVIINVHKISIEVFDQFKLWGGLGFIEE